MSRKQRGGLSKRQYRIARSLLPEYLKALAKPQRGAIRYGRGLDVMAWTADAQAQGYHVSMAPDGVELR